MYDINAGNARPEMAEVGKGSNQLADYKPVERAIEADAAMQERKAAAKKKADEARQEQVYNALSSIDAKAVKPNDVTYFSDKIQSLYNDAAKKMNSAGEITPQDRNALEASIAQIKAEAAASGNTKSFVQGELARAYAAPPGTYRDEDIKKLEDRIASPEHIKNWDTGDLRLNVNKNLQEDINKTILPAREKLAVEGSVEFPTASGSIIKIDKKDLSPEIEQNLYNDWVSNNYEQLSYDLRKKQARGDEEAISYKNDVNQYADKVYKPQFSLHEEKRGYQRPLQGEGEGAGAEKQPNVNMTFTKYGKGDWRGTLEYTKTPDNPYQAQTVLDPETGKFIQADVKPQAIVSKGGKQWIEAITRPTVDELGMKVPPKIVQIPYDAGGKEMLHDKFGIDNVFNIEASGGKNKPENINLNYQDISKAGQERAPQTGAIQRPVSSQAIGTPTSTTTPGIGLPKKPAAQVQQPAQAQKAQQSNDILSSLDAEQDRYYNKGLNYGNNPQDIKDFHAGYVDIAKNISQKYLNQPDSKELKNKEFEESINQFMDYEHKNSESVDNYHGGGSNWGTNNDKITTKEQAKEHYKKYWDTVKDLPPGIRTRAFQLAINTGDPYGELMVANGLMSAEERSKSKNTRRDAAGVPLDPKDFNKKELKKLNEKLLNTSITPASKDEINKQIKQLNEDKKKVDILLNNLKQSPSAAAPEAAVPSTTAGMSATQWNQKWASLPKGQSLVGLDGKTYTKK